MKACARTPSRATKTSVTARFSPAAANARVRSATTKASIALGRARQRDHAAFRKAARGGGRGADWPFDNVHEAPPARFNASRGASAMRAKSAVS